MKIANNTPEIEFGNVQEHSEFRIRNSAKAFKILSSNLYSDKISAIVRELGCNAYDSHVNAGKADQPFTVHLPNPFEPYFSVRDYGTGLSHDDVINIYTTYFESTKTDSNDFTGCLGLGSKSPFSYVNNFTVTSWHNGIKNIYSAYLNDKGIPSVVLMDSTSYDSTEGNGIEVQFPVVEKRDFNLFVHAAQNIYWVFKTKPEVVGSSNFKFQEMELKEITKGVYQTKMHNLSYALQGNVLYPIDINLVKGFDYDHLLSFSFLIEFEVGDLDIAPSREALSYDETTISNIRQKYKYISESIQPNFKENLNKCETKIDRAKFLLETLGQRSLYYQCAVDHLENSDNNELLISVYNDYSSGNKYVFRPIDESFVNEIDCNVTVYSTDYYRTKFMSKKKYSSEFFQDRNIATSPHSDKFHFVVVDKKVHAMSKIHNRYNHPHTQVIAFVPENKDADIKGICEKIYERWGVKAQLASELPTPTPIKNKTTNVSGLTNLVEKVDDSSYRRSKYRVFHPVKQAQLDEMDTVYYLPLNQYNFKLFGTLYSKEEIEYVINDLKRVGIFTKNNTIGDIIGVRPSGEKFTKLANWKSFEEFIVEELVKKENMVKSMTEYEVLIRHFNMKLLQMLNQQLTNGKMKDFLTKYQSSLEPITGIFSVEVYDSLIRRAGIKQDCNINTCQGKISAEIKDLLNRYPMLTYVNRSTIDDEHKVKEYIELIDSQTGETK